jgi:acyl-CoA synthetase (AMP-forming)/AMP-acid ligase II
MLGLMQDFPLTIEAILRHGERMYGAKTIVTQQAQGSERITLAALAARARQVAGILDRLGVSPEGRVGSFGWNTANHVALYFGVPCTGDGDRASDLRLEQPDARHAVLCAIDGGAVGNIHIG